MKSDKKKVIHTIIAIHIAIVVVLLFVTPTHAVSQSIHTESKNEIARQEKIIAILTQLIALVKQHKASLHTVETTPVETVINNVKVKESISEIVSTTTVGTDMDHHEKHHRSTSTPKLVIEVESHGNTTHVHMRYPDKPETQFFITASLYDEEAIIRDIGVWTGLSESVIRPALLYFY